MRGRPLQRRLDNLNLHINVLISIPDEGPPLLKSHLSGEMWMTSHCNYVWSHRVLRFWRTEPPAIKLSE